MKIDEKKAAVIYEEVKKFMLERKLENTLSYSQKEYDNPYSENKKNKKTCYEEKVQCEVRNGNDSFFIKIKQYKENIDGLKQNNQPSPRFSVELDLVFNGELVPIWTMNTVYNEFIFNCEAPSEKFPFDLIEPEIENIDG